MATNHTTNYALNLWEPTDAFLREEFNENSEKIDAALHNRITFGTYTGNGAENREIVIGKRARALYVCTIDGATCAFSEYRGGLAMDGFDLSVSGKPILSITDEGFLVHYIPITNSSRVSTNEANTIYYYMAIF